MSIRIMAKVWELYPGGGTELLSLLALADWSDDDGRCYPSMAAIAKKTRLSISQARRVVHGLIGDGFVQVIGNENGGPPGSSRQYRIDIGHLTACIGASGTASAHATPSTDARASTHARDGLHGCAETASAHASLTIIEPSITVNDSDQASPDHGIQLEKIPDCPHQQIIALYAKHLPQLPQPRVWEGKRSDNLRSRWRWVLTAKKSNGHRYAHDLQSALSFFDRYFGYVAASDFLTGRDGKWQGCDLAWLVKAENFAKVIEGKYENRLEAAA
jgi:hypothetical protein